MRKVGVSEQGAASLNYFLIFIAVLALGASYWLGYTPLIVPVAYLALGAATFLFYAKDKSAAQSGDWRVSESTLHVLSLLGGWPGAIFAQQRLRHKTKKLAFRIPFWITVIANVACTSDLQ